MKRLVLIAGILLGAIASRPRMFRRNSASLGSPRCRGKGRPTAMSALMRAGRSLSTMTRLARNSASSSMKWNFECESDRRDYLHDPIAAR